MLILIVGSLGLFSNIVGMFVLGGHGHSHGGEGHEHGHSHGNAIRAAEEGHGHESHRHTGSDEVSDESGFVGDVLPEATLSSTEPKKSRHRHDQKNPSLYATDEHAGTSNGDGGGGKSRTARRHRRRASSIRSNRFSSIEDLSIHPASLRQNIIAASRPTLDGIASEDGTGSEGEVDTAVQDDAAGSTEASPLLAKITSPPRGNGHVHSVAPKARADSWHVGHNHNKPKKQAKSHGHNHADMGMRAMLLHVAGDALGNIGVIVSALVIWLSDWSGRFYADPAVSLFITVIILYSCIPLSKASASILLQAVPEHIDVDDIKEDIQELPGVVSCHHVHVWQLSEQKNIASLHIQVAFPLDQDGGSARYMQLALAARKCLHAYGIHSSTIQPEFCLDDNHDHAEDAAMHLDGSAQDEDACLLDCGDDCGNEACCPPASLEPPRSELGHDNNHDHSHNGHSH